MAELSEDRFVVELEKLEEKTDSVLSYSITSNYLTPCDEFEFTVFNLEDPRSLRRKWMPLRRVSLYIDGAKQLMGRIDSTKGNSDGSLTVKGRDYRSDIVDGGADPSMAFTENMSLKAALLMLFQPYGIRDLQGSWNTMRKLLSGKDPFKGSTRRDFQQATLKDFKIEENHGTMDVANELLSRHGFTLQAFYARDIASIVAPQYDQEILFGLKKPDNIIEGTASRDYGDVPTVTITKGRAVGSQPGKQADPMLGQYPSFGDLALISTISNSPEVLRITGTEAGGDEMRTIRANWKKVQSETEDFVLYKPMFFQDKKSKTPQQLERVIRKDLSRRLKETLVYECTVRGHRDPASGAIYTIDTMAHVNDETEDVDEDLWILERKLSNDGKSGPRTSLQLVRPGSIQL